MNITHTVLVLSLLVLGACSSVDVTQTSRDFHDPTNPKEVEILRTVPQEDFQEVGTFTASGFKGNETSSMHETIRSEAAKVGGHAALIQDTGIIPQGFGSYDQWCSGVVLRFSNP